jgi:cytochrome b
MLALSILQVAAGLVIDDEVATTGPRSRLVSSATAARATVRHADVGNWRLILMVVLHLAAIVFCAVKKRRRLVPAMWHGDKLGYDPVEASRDAVVVRLAALVVLALVIALSGLIWSLGAP